MLRKKIKMLLCASMVCSMMFAAVDTLSFNQVLAEDSNAGTPVVNIAETSENSEEPVTINNVELKNKLAEAAGKGSDYTGDLTADALASITGDIDLSNLDITDDDMPIMKYLTGVSGINLSNNTDITYVGFNKNNFDWTEPKDLNFSGCTGIKCSNQSGQGQSAFEGCSNLNSIILPENISYLSTSMFKGTGLTSITIPDTVTAMGDNVFSGCTNLKEANLGSGLSNLGNTSFDGTALTYIKIPASVTSLGMQSLYNTNLALLDAIGTNLKPIKVKGRIPDTAVALYGQNINLSSDKLNLKSGDTQTITFTAQLPDGKNLTWGSTNPNVVTVSENGEITAVSPGTTFVYATTDLVPPTESTGIVPSTTYSGFCTITVAGTDVKSSNADLSSLALSGVTLNEDFDPAVTDYTASVGSEVTSTDITVAAADDKAKVKVSVNGEDVSGQQINLNVGENDIKVEVTAEDNTVKTYSITVTRAEAQAVPVTGITLDKTSTTIEVGGTDQLKAVVVPEDAANKNVTWTSDKPEIVAVDQTGNITAVAEGTATITAVTEDGNKTAACTVTVTDNSQTNPVDITTDLPENASFELGSDARVTINAVNNSDEDQPVSLILALFNKDDNSFVTYMAGQQDVSSKGSTALTGGIKLPGMGNYELRAFVWNGLDDMKPLSDVRTIPVVADK